MRCREVFGTAQRLPKIPVVLGCHDIDYYNWVKSYIALIPVLVLLLAPAPLWAPTTFNVTIDGDSNVPPLPVGATGTAVLILNDAQTELSYNITFQGLTTPETNAHIHNAGFRDNGPIAFFLPLGSPKVGFWAIPPEFVVELFKNKLYINIHSEFYVGGEIRGNIANGVPVEESTWGRIKALYQP